MTTLASLHLRLDPRDDADLRWFWGEAEGELGVRASDYEPRIQRPTVDPESPTGDPLVDRRALAAERYERISRTLSRMPVRLMRALQRWCGQYRASADVAVAFGHFAGLAALVTPLPPPRCAYCGSSDLSGSCEERVRIRSDAKQKIAARLTKEGNTFSAMMVRARYSNEWDDHEPAPQPTRASVLESLCREYLHGTKTKRVEARERIALIRADAQRLLAEAAREYGQCKPRRTKRAA